MGKPKQENRRGHRIGSFASVDILNTKIRNYIDFYNQTAKFMKWKYPGLPVKKYNVSYLKFRVQGFDLSPLPHLLD